MEIRRFLAMTGAEMAQSTQLPPHIGWMACHFSGDGGITNLPHALPPHSLLILDDSVPPQNVNPNRIREIVGAVLHNRNCYGLLLDFQRQDLAENLAITKALVSLPYPVAVSEAYGKDLSCPVFLPPAPLDTPLAEYLAPYRGREIWLELALDTLQLQLTPEGCTRKPAGSCQEPLPFSDTSLHCRYRIECQKNCAVFTLQRTKADLLTLLKEAKSLGVTAGVGLYQELKEM